MLSTVDAPAAHDPVAVRRLRKQAFGRILAEERPRLTTITALLDQLEQQIAGWE